MTNDDKTKIAVELFDKYADLYTEKYMDVSLYQPQLDRLCDLLPRCAEVLELACGPGNVSKYILDRRNDLYFLGTDLSQKMIDIAQEQNPAASFKLMDCRAIKPLNKCFDAIICAFGLPYLAKEEALLLISEASSSLKSGGKIYLSFMTGDYSRSGWQASSKGDQIYLYYHQQDYMVECLEESGFKIDTLDKIESTMNGIEVTDLIIIAVKSS